VRCGHDYRTIAVENGVVIDLSQMKTVTIDPARTAQIQAGATAGDLIETAQQYGLATTTERSPALAWLDLP